MSVPTRPGFFEGRSLVTWVTIVLVAIPVIALWVWALADLLRRRDLSTGRKAIWIIGVLLLPLAGSVLYLAFKPARDVDIRGFGGPDRHHQAERPPRGGPDASDPG